MLLGRQGRREGFKGSFGRRGAFKGSLYCLTSLSETRRNSSGTRPAGGQGQSFFSGALPPCSLLGSADNMSLISHAWLREVVSLVLMAKQHLLLTVISVADGSDVSESTIV